jgi:hypothetical protein
LKQSIIFTEKPIQQKLNSYNVFLIALLFAGQERPGPQHPTLVTPRPEFTQPTIPPFGQRPGESTPSTFERPPSGRERPGESTPSPFERPPSGRERPGEEFPGNLVNSC